MLLEAFAESDARLGLSTLVSSVDVALAVLSRDPSDAEVSSRDVVLSETSCVVVSMGATCFVPGDDTVSDVVPAESYSVLAFDGCSDSEAFCEVSSVEGLSGLACVVTMWFTDWLTLASDDV